MRRLIWTACLLLWLPELMNFNICSSTGDVLNYNFDTDIYSKLVTFCRIVSWNSPLSPDHICNLNLIVKVIWYFWSPNEDYVLYIITPCNGWLLGVVDYEIQFLWPIYILSSETDLTQSFIFFFLSVECSNLWASIWRFR